MCITVKKILGSDMPKSQKCRAIYQKGVYVSGLYIGRHWDDYMSE